ncbi:MAG: hypothetical protein ACK5GI_08110 [Ignavibacteria bacterium]
MLLGLILAASSCYAQQLQSLLTPQERVPGKGIEFGVDKITNTFVWTGNADVDLSTSVGQFRFVNQYRSSAFRTASVATRDDQQSQIAWEVPVAATLRTVLRQGWLLSQDSRSIGLNSLQRINGALGLVYNPMPEATVEALGGLESSSQLGVQATGPIAIMKGTLDNYLVDDWDISSNAIADWQQLDTRRTNTDLDVSARVSRIIDEGTSLKLSAQSTLRGREFFTSVSPSLPLNVEQRRENIQQVFADISYGITPELGIGFSGSLLSNSIDRSYDTPMQDLALTSVSRQLSELAIDAEAHVQYRVQNITAYISGAVYQRSEQNGVQDVFGLIPSSLQAVRAQEFQRDNETFRTRLLSRGEYLPTERDTFRLDISGWLLRYDTPSPLNDDDRDELSTIATASWSRKLSSNLSMNLGLSGQYLHLVFLRATRSAFNNVNRVLRLTPSFVLHTSGVTMQPQFEILANYTAYDYDGLSSAARSFSFRQISYRDSLRVRLTPTFNFESQILFRYFERASLQWGAFAESPETGNLEYLVKLLLATNVTPLASIHTGLRLYTLDQRSIAIGVPQLLTGSLHSIGPEVAIRYATMAGSTLSLSGWYEFQTINVTQTRKLPNVLLRCIVRI